MEEPSPPLLLNPTTAAHIERCGQVRGQLEDLCSPRFRRSAASPPNAFGEHCLVCEHLEGDECGSVKSSTV
jgi:hypothetical protein